MTLTIDCTNSLTKILILDAKVYPNPFNNFVNIQLDEICHNLSLAVYDLKGELIAKRNYQNIINLTYFVQAPPGIYILQLSNNKGKIAAIKLTKL